LQVGLPGRRHCQQQVYFIRQTAWRQLWLTGVDAGGRAQPNRTSKPNEPTCE